MSRWKVRKRPVYREGPKTFWNYMGVNAVRVNVVVASSIPDGWWCAGLENTVRRAVRITTDASTFYIDDEDGFGWHKVTKGMGSARLPHRSLPVSREVAP